ncbi:helix-turn-helix protein [Algoriphagus boseongensis]|uniref:Helix-turn-helix protein n=1 Tax=Algoriphagus boseongensis TaxID=1442587 RepID=A0A4R6T7C7_9BACT|nr:helix-turn-helix transcriptional regulator [Algoriphagus boseongensis]TDQ16570.1 helix-turn-helix protein [Algoriphagus boseongensis]
MNIGEQIKSSRIAKAWTQSELAEKCGLTLRTIQRIEKGTVNPSPYSLKKFQEVFVGEFQLDSAIQPNQNSKPKTKKLMHILSIGSIAAGIIWILSVFFPSTSSIISNEISLPVEIVTVNCGSDTECDIQLTLKNDQGEILWQKIYGGSSYDKAGGVASTADGGFLILGSTSSFGKGNYDVLLIKVNANGEVLWQKTYGEFFNEYGYQITQMSSSGNFEIEGSRQTCSTPNVSNSCKDYVWTFQIDEEGNLIS